MTTEDRARFQYQNNPLAKTFVDVLCTQIEIRPTAGSVYMILAHDGLLSMLELGDDELQSRLAKTQIMGPGPIAPAPEEPKHIWLPR